MAKLGRGWEMRSYGLVLASIVPDSGGVEQTA
jgi:hypothetical protein